jgi:parallel beta-helix repeat protein
MHRTTITASIYIIPNNTLRGNNASNNENGINIWYSSSNTIYNNYFSNTNNANNNGNNIWNTTKTSGINIIGGPYLGGNFWAHPDGTGFSQTCGDANKNGICDSNYSLAPGNVDYLPLAEIPSGSGYISGRILNNSTGIDNANVSTNTSITTNTDASGSYSLLVPAGSYKLLATGEPGFYPNNSITVTAVAGMTLMQDIELIKKPAGNISGSVYTK